MDEQTERKKVKHNRNSNEYKAKKPKVLYNRKFRKPLRKKRKNEYDPDEEAR